MKKLLLFFITCSILSVNAYAESENITGILYEGLLNVKLKTIRKQVKSKVGKLYDESIVKQDIQNILDLEYFEDAEVNKEASSFLSIVMLDAAFLPVFSSSNNS